MFDFGWVEILLILVVALFAIGPQDIPKVMYQAGRLFRRIGYMRYGLSRQFEAFMEETELKASAKDKPHDPENDPDIDGPARKNDD